MAIENSPKNRQRRQLERKLGQRPSHDRILIVCEGSKTEPQYFEEIRQYYRLQTTSITVLQCQTGTSPIQVVEYAKELFENGDPHKRIQPRAFEQIYAVFDRDSHESYFKALNLAKKLNKTLKNENKETIQFLAIPSIPNFELWLLLHYVDIKHFIPRNEVYKKLKLEIKQYTKGLSGTFAITRNSWVTAYERAKSLSSNAFDDTNLYTDVGNLVELLTNLKR